MDATTLIEMDWSEVRVSLDGEVYDDQGNEVDLSEMEAALKDAQEKLAEAAKMVAKLRKMVKAAE